MKQIFTNTLGVALGILSVVPAQAALIDFSTFNAFGDVSITSLGAVALSNNALQNDDSPLLDEPFNFSGNPAVDISTLETGLGLPPFSLDPISGVSATEGSGVGNTLTVTVPTTYSFDWIFYTNDETFSPEGVGDYAFAFIGDSIVPIASTENMLEASTFSPFAFEISGDISTILPPGVYNVGLGVVDVVDFDNSSAFVITNAQLIPVVPEPATIMGLSLGLLGASAVLKKRK